MFSKNGSGSSGGGMMISFAIFISLMIMIVRAKDEMTTGADNEMNHLKPKMTKDGVHRRISRNRFSPDDDDQLSSNRSSIVARNRRFLHGDDFDSHDEPSGQKPIPISQRIDNALSEATRAATRIRELSKSLTLLAIAVSKQKIGPDFKNSLLQKVENGETVDLLELL